ncbi:hypothetical protein [Paraburkholderia youngii]|uniref:hypothetical protein n=1 Tax=Paraburkholderia youngii TaxID=2782701 RepID=UPI001595C423|nr:hypothetical protein [Paraburkholderia youngii]
MLHPVGEPAVDEHFRLIDDPGLFVRRPILEALLAPQSAVGIMRRFGLEARV